MPLSEVIEKIENTSPRYRVVQILVDCLKDGDQELSDKYLKSKLLSALSRLGFEDLIDKEIKDAEKTLDMPGVVHSFEDLYFAMCLINNAHLLSRLGLPYDKDQLSNVISKFCHIIGSLPWFEYDGEPPEWLISEL